MASSSEIVSEGIGYIDSRGSFTQFIRDVVIGGPLTALAYTLVDGIQGAGTLLLAPVRALGLGMVTLVDALIGGLVSVFGAGTETTVLAFTDGVTRYLGPLAQPVSVGVIMLSLGVFLYGVNRLEINPLSFLTSIRG